jgi:hypothetical protein
MLQSPAPAHEGGAWHVIKPPRPGWHVVPVGQLVPAVQTCLAPAGHVPVTHE